MSGHSLFDKNELYLGNNVVSFEFLQRMYEQGKTTSQIGGYVKTDWLDISINPTGVHSYHYMNVNEALVFPISDTESIIMYSMSSASGIDISIERRVNGVSDFIRVMDFTVNEEDKLVLSSDRVTHLYRGENDTVFETIERFELVNHKLENGSTEKRWHNSTDISLRYEGGHYHIYGPLNVYSLPANSYEIISNYDAVDGIGEYNNTFMVVDKASFEDIRMSLLGMDFEQASQDFQTAIAEKGVNLVTDYKEQQH